MCEICEPDVREQEVADDMGHTHENHRIQIRTS